jgi:7-keto-8-aminopelargonate synthetase-like enzyme
MTEPEPLQPLDRTYVRYRRRKLSSFSGCDYFRLSSHPAVVQAAAEGLKESGLNVAASRLTTGNHSIYRALEKELTDFFRTEDALLLPTGYLTSLTVAQALAGQFSHVVVDEYAHPALLDAAQVLDGPVLTFGHCDVESFNRTLQRCGRNARPIVLTDGMFAHNGSVAPLKMYLDFLPRDGLLLVDDAHGAGVLGKTGRGSLEIEGVSRRRIIQCITLSKAFGVFGGAVLGSRSLREKILTRSRLFIGCTPLPPPMAAAALTAVTILKTDRSLRRRLSQNTTYVKVALRKAGLAFPETLGPVVALQPSSPRVIRALKRRLFGAGIFPPFLKYPGGPANGYFRFVISSEHNRAQLDNLIKTLTRPL